MSISSLESKVLFLPLSRGEDGLETSTSNGMGIPLSSEVRISEADEGLGAL
jgi:hypothetical protein